MDEKTVEYKQGGCAYNPTFTHNRSARAEDTRLCMTVGPHMIKQSRERKKVQNVIRALLSPTKELKRAMASSPVKTPSSRRTLSMDESSSPGKQRPSSRRSLSMDEGNNGRTPPVGSLLGMAPSPYTPADGQHDDDDDDDLMTPTPVTRLSPQHEPGITPELRAALPNKPLTTWTTEDVAGCLKLLGREMAREGTNSARDVAAFDAYAETFLAQGIDGLKFVSISIPQLNHELGVSSFNHRLKIVTWIKAYLEVSRVVFFSFFPAGRSLIKKKKNPSKLEKKRKERTKRRNSFRCLFFSPSSQRLRARDTQPRGAHSLFFSSCIWHSSSWLPPWITSCRRS